eukprot:g48326.t1
MHDFINKKVLCLGDTETQLSLVLAREKFGQFPENLTSQSVRRPAEKVGFRMRRMAPLPESARTSTSRRSSFKSPSCTHWA